MPTPTKVAVIGAGVSGLLTARELGREGHRVTVFEQGDRVGGLWVYDPRTETDLLGMDPNRGIVHSSLYKSLRTNLPRSLMGFLDYPFVVRDGGDARDYPCHEEVLAFVENFAKDFGLMELIRFGSRVVRVEMVEGKGWVVEWQNLTAGTAEEEVFDAVVVCNGHYTQPQIAEIPGIEKWPGRQIHSHNYRTREPFRDQVIVVVGNGPSADDISKELASVAKEIHLASRSPDIQVGKLANHTNIWQHPMVIDAQEDGSLLFQDGTSLVVDTILYCTGYKYSFPFDLTTNGYIKVENNRIHPLYKHIFPPRFAPSLSFIGIPFKAISNFLVKELQAKWLASVLSGKVSLPSEEDMMASIENHYLKLKEEGKPEHYTHCLFLYEFAYVNWIVDELGLPALDPGLEETYTSTIKRILSKNAEEYRDS